MVTWKVAMTLDGRTATATGDSRWITSRAARRLVHRMRSASGAIITGIGTVRRDDPLLTARAVGEERQPLRVVLDARCELPRTSQLVRTACEVAPVLVAATADAPASARAQLIDAGVEVVELPSDPGGRRVSVGEVVAMLGERGVLAAMLECGGTLARSFLDARLIDRARVFVAPRLLGGTDSMGVLAGDSPPTIGEAFEARSLRSRRVGPDLLLEAELLPPPWEA
jgi:diaminohydroxyphosphoribosylaminopyrimidine deaminase/5-amino-6-(5-phosphoribosylamino)uracil reductase